MRLLAAAALGLLALAPALGRAQPAIERNLPPAAATPQGEDILPPNARPDSEDATPLGPMLTGLVLLGPRDEALDAPVEGLDAGRVARLAQAPLVVQRLFETRRGQPLSRKMIAEIEADIALYYRDLGFPFVALSTPPQELTAGVLQVRVVEFTAGTVTVAPGRRATAPYVRRRLRQDTGEAIDARRLSQDLGWLNRNPFRDARAVFQPGDGLGRSDVTVTVAEARPWRLYGGVFSSDSPSRGGVRWYAGGQAAPFRAWPDALISYQATGSDDAFDDRAAYRSQALSFDIGLAPRLALEAVVDGVETHQAAERVFDTVLQVSEATAGARFAAGPHLDARLGVEARRVRRSLLFGGVKVFESRLEVFQLYAGAEGALRDRFGRATYSLTLHTSPGGVGDDNVDGAFAVYSNGRVRSAQYAYLAGDLTHTAQFGRLTLVDQLIGRLGSTSLPDTEQMGLGGASMVRGYVLEDGAFDDVLVSRNTLYMPGVGMMQPFILADAAYADLKYGPSFRPLSLGAGASLRLTRFANAELTAARAMTSAARTSSGDWRLNARLGVFF